MIGTEPRSTRRSLRPRRKVPGPRSSRVPPRSRGPRPDSGPARCARTRLSLSSRLPPSPLPPGITYISTLRLDGVPPDLQWMASSLGALSPRSTNPVTATSRPLFTQRSLPQCHSGHVPGPGPARATWQTPPPAAARLLAHRAPATGPAWTQRIPPGSGAYHRPTPFRDRSRQGAMLGSSRLGFP
jgi:hypothetical protein